MLHLWRSTIHHHHNWRIFANWILIFTPALILITIHSKLVSKITNLNPRILHQKLKLSVNPQIWTCTKHPYVKKCFENDILTLKLCLRKTSQRFNISCVKCLHVLIIFVHNVLVFQVSVKTAPVISCKHSFNSQQ